MEVNASLINFAAGQLSKKFLGRVDLPNFYNAGTLVCRNFIPQAQGPAEFRVGSQYVFHTRLNKTACLYPFVFNDEQAYALEFTDKKLRFYSDGGVILESAGVSQRQLLIHFDGVDGATTYTAESGQTCSFTGTAQLDTAQKKFGTASLLVDGNSDYVTVPTHANWNFGSGDFTLEAWVRFASIAGNQTVFGHSSSANEQMRLAWEGGTNWRFLVVTGGSSVVDINVADAAVVINTWYHISLVREGNTFTLRKDGVTVGTDTYAGAIADNSATFSIGKDQESGYYFNGWIDEVSVLKGIATWSADFTPPTTAYSSTGETVITGITAANPGVVTAVGHGYSTGDEIYISEVEGMVELNNAYYLVVKLTNDTFSLTDIDGTAIDTSAFTAYTTGGTCDKVYEITTPYAEADISGFQFAQKADLMYIFHANYEPRKLVRASETSWSLSTYTRTADPFTKALTGITAANPGVVTAAAHGFSDGDIVEIWGVVGMTEVNGNAYKVASAAAGSFSLTDPVTGANIDTSAYTPYVSGGYIFKQGNMPIAGGFYGGRLFVGGTNDDPETFWGSKAPTNAGVTQYDDFTVGAGTGDAVTFPISSPSNTADRIQWIAGTNKFLGIGTFGGVCKANGGTDSTPISGTAIAVQAVEFTGCKQMAPVRMGNSLFYVQRGGLTLNNFAYSFLSEDFKASSLNIFSDEITKTGITQLAIQQGLADIIWAVTTEGKLIGLTIKTGEEISAWHSHEIGGADVKVLSVCGEPQLDNRDSLWIVVERTINSLTRRYVEYIQADVVLPEPEDYYTDEANSTSDNTTYESLLYEQAKELIRVDSSLSLSGAQNVVLTPGAVTGTGITFTALSNVFAATDVGRRIVRKYVDGTESGRALITAYTSPTVVTCTIETDFDSVTNIPAGEWYLTFTSVTGLDHLEGEIVAAQIDGEDDGTDYTVASGTITLASAATYVHVGLRYMGRLTTMPLNIGAMVGTAQGKITTVNRLCLLFRHARATKYGTDLYRLEQVLDRDISPVAYRPSRLKTDVEFLNIPDGYDRRKYVHIIQDTANPCTIQGIAPYVDTTNE